MTPSPVSDAAIALLDVQIDHLTALINKWKQEKFWEIGFCAPGSTKAWAVYALKNATNVRNLLIGGTP